MTARENSFKGARITIIILAILGLGLSYLALEQHVLYVHGLEAGESFCNINELFNCEAVNASEWSTIFGFPIASYGLFFYSVLLLGTLSVRVGGALTPRAWSSIVLMLSGIASVGSIALFVISKVFIGALCLMCIGMYLINFATLGIVWRRAWRGQFSQGLAVGVSEVRRLCAEVLGIASSPFALTLRILTFVMVVLGVVNLLLPSVLLYIFLDRSERAAEARRDPVVAWKQNPAITFDLDISGGVFGDYHLGSSSAPIQIVEFADYECPACRRMYRSMKEVLQGYEGKYLFVFKNYPLDKSCNPTMTREAHKYACTAAYFSRCAGEQGKFWESMEILFLRDADEGELSRESLTSEGAKELSLDEDAVVECMRTDRYRERIVRDINDGERANLQGTPSIWVNGRAVNNPTPEALRAIFDSILKSAK